MNAQLKWFIFALAIVGFCLISVFCGIDLVFMLAFTTWCIGFYYAISNKYLLLASFLTAFFAYLVGGHFVHEFFGMRLSYYFNDEYYSHSNMALFISLLSILISYGFSMLSSRNRKRIRTTSSSPERMRRIRATSKVLFFATYLFWLYVLMDKAFFVMASSYYSYYTEFESNVPLIIRSIAAMCPFFFYVFLATFPKKAECRVPIILFALYAAISLLTGRRGDFVNMLLFLFIYFALRHYFSKEGEKWLTRRFVILVLISAPVGLGFLYSYRYIRFGLEAADTSLMEKVFGFFQQQGISSSLLRLGKYHQDSLNESAYYSFYGLVKWVRTNTVFRLLLDPQYGFSYSNNNIALATQGNSFAHALSYVTLGNRYLSGTGLGSCYIAELYHDFGYIGIALGNYVYGTIISKVDRAWFRTSQSVWVLAFCFGLFDSFLKAPRFNFDIIFTSALQLGMWSAFVMVFVLVALLTKRVKVTTRDDYSL